MGKSTPFAIDYGYVNAGRVSNPPSQSKKFKDAARKLGADEDEKRWDERLRKVVEQKPGEDRK